MISTWDNPLTMCFHGYSRCTDLHNGKMLAEAKALSEAFHKKGDEFSQIVKMGRTEGQDAVPMTVGQEFHAFGYQLDGAIEALQKAEEYPV